MEDQVAASSTEGASAEETASVSASTEQPTEVKSTPAKESSEEKANTVEETTGESKDSDQSIPYSRFSEVINERNEYKAKAELLDKIQSDPQFASQLLNKADPNAPVSQEAQAKQTLRRLGIPDDKSVKGMIQEAIRQERVYREIDAKVEQLQKEWNGKDGKPLFNVDEIVEYGNKTGVYDPEAAFKLIHEKELADFYSKQGKSGIKTERQGKPVQNVGRDDEALRKEAIASGDWTRYLQTKL